METPEAAGKLHELSLALSGTVGTGSTLHFCFSCQCPEPTGQGRVKCRAPWIVSHGGMRWGGASRSHQRWYHRTHQFTAVPQYILHTFFVRPGSQGRVQRGGPRLNAPKGSSNHRMRESVVDQSMYDVCTYLHSCTYARRNGADYDIHPFFLWCHPTTHIR